jgi:hypothetical protein
MKPAVSIGPTSVIGWLTAACAVTASIITAITGSSAELSGTGKWTAILGIVTLAITQIGRYLQALQTGTSLPTNEEELAEQPESARTPDPVPLPVPIPPA